MSRHAFVTGATGFLGGLLVRRLLDQGWTVDAWVRSSAAADRLPPGVVAVSGPSLAVVQRLKDHPPMVVFHLAALYLRHHNAEDVAPLIDANVRLEAELLDAMARTGVRAMVRAGTTFQHYRGTAGRSLNLYAATKAAAEPIAAYFADAFGIRVVSLHLTDTYGPEDRRQKLFRLLHTAALNGQPLDMSPGEQRVDLLHGSDAVSAFIRGAELACVDQGNVAYGVSSGCVLTLREVITLWSSVGGDCPEIRWGGRAYAEREHMAPYLPPLLPGWSPQVALADGLRQLATAYRTT